MIQKLDLLNTVLSEIQVGSEPKNEIMINISIIAGNQFFIVILSTATNCSEVSLIPPLFKVKDTSQWVTKRLTYQELSPFVPPLELVPQLQLKRKAPPNWTYFGTPSSMCRQVVEDILKTFLLLVRTANVRGN